jgi:pSer/pThr/pTyr-binding forkhead associated (FHA) protein
LIAAHPVVVQPSLTIVRSPEDPSSQGRQILLTQFPYMIGRVDGNLLIQDANLSRRHAQITVDAASQSYFITDLNSSNGTRLNGVPLVSGQAKQLSSGALINLGPNVVVRFDLA